MIATEPTAGYLDSLIYSVFEEQEDTFAYPLTSEKEAKEFVLSLNKKGCKYDMIGTEVGSEGGLFEKWRLGEKDSNKSLSTKVIERINRPFQDTMASVNDKDGGLLATQISLDEVKVKRPIEKNTFASKTLAIIEPALKTDRNNLNTKSKNMQLSEQSTSQLQPEVPKMNKSQQLELLLKQKYMLKQSTNESTSAKKQDSARDQMPYQFTSSVAKNSSATQNPKASSVKQDLARDQIPYRFPSSATKIQTLSSNTSSSSSVKSVGIVSTVNNTIVSSGSVASLNNSKKPAITTNTKLTTNESSKNYPTPLSTSKVILQTTNSSTTSRLIVQSTTLTATPSTINSQIFSPSTNSKVYSAVKPLSTSEASVTSSKIAATSITLLPATTTSSTVSSPIPKKVEVDEKESERASSPLTTSSHYKPVTPDFTPEQLNCMINYNSDDDNIKSNSSKHDTSLCFIKAGSLLILSDIPAGHMKLSKFTKFRIKLLSSRQPLNRFKQALNFNPDLRILANIKVEDREESLTKVKINLTSYALKNKNDWYWATLNQIFTAIEKALAS